MNDPVPEIPSPVPESRIGEAARSTAIKILIVDDEETIQQLLRTTIEQTLGYQVDCAGSAEEAFRIYKKNIHPVIVLDIRLGGESGISLLKRIKRNDPAVNVIMITGYGTIDMAVECMKEGAWDFISKPFSTDHFEWVIRRAVENFRLKTAAEERDYYLELARIDSLTEVYNQRLFHVILESEIARAKRYRKKFALLFLDMDNFKSVNDTFGHPKGDELLKRMALTMKKHSRESDFLFRYGGDEFAVILPETDKEGALIYAKRLKDEVEKLEIQGKTLEGTTMKHPVTISIGASVYPTSAKSKESLIHSADKAMLQAKARDKNRVVFL